MESKRLILFVDGNNWYSGLRADKVRRKGRLDYAKISHKLVNEIGSEEAVWVQTRYYLGPLEEGHKGQAAFIDEQRFLTNLHRHPSISLELGRLISLQQENPLTSKVLEYVARRGSNMDPEASRELAALAKKEKFVEYRQEKGVDVSLAVDMLTMAFDGHFDVALLLSADADFVPLVKKVQAVGKRVVAVSLHSRYSVDLRGAVDDFIRLRKSWFADCYRQQERRCYA